MNQIYHLMCSRQAELIQEIEYIQQLLSSMPDKFLICAKMATVSSGTKATVITVAIFQENTGYVQSSLQNVVTSIVACSICKLKNERSTRL